MESKNLMRWAQRLALGVWEAPQSSLGLLRVALALGLGKVHEVRFDDERVMVELTEGAAVSLGLFVLWTNQDNPYVPVGKENRSHEYGHSIQSRWLGPLYLPVVGVPSTLRVGYAVAHKLLRGRRWAGYYDGFPEDWADRLGRVDRTLRPEA